MAGIVGLRSRRNDGRRRQPMIIFAAIAILAAVVLVCAGLVAVPLWTALIADQCQLLKGARAREACDEKLRVGGPPHPAKGANAPIMLRSPE